MTLLASIWLGGCQPSFTDELSPVIASAPARDAGYQEFTFYASLSALEISQAITRSEQHIYANCSELDPHDKSNIFAISNCISPFVMLTDHLSVERNAILEGETRARYLDIVEYYVNLDVSFQASGNDIINILPDITDEECRLLSRVEVHCR
jgi:hypothetical protein